MDTNEFIANFAEQFFETDSSIFTAETEFKTLEEWSSLSALSILAMVDEEYDVLLKGEELRNCTTIQDLISFIETRI